MPVPFKIGGGQGFYNGQPVFSPGVEDYYESFINEGRLKNQPLNYQNFKPFTKEGASAAFQNFFNEVTSDPVRFTPGYSPLAGGTGYKQEAQQLMNAFLGRGINLQDDTGSVSLTPGGIGVRSNKGWGASVNPYGGEINIGPVGIQGTWAGDKSIQATVNLGNKPMQIPGVYPENISNFLYPQMNEPASLTSPARALMEEQTEDYTRRNPNYRYQ